MHVRPVQQHVIQNNFVIIFRGGVHDIIMLTGRLINFFGRFKRCGEYSYETLPWTILVIKTFKCCIFIDFN